MKSESVSVTHRWRNKSGSGNPAGQLGQNTSSPISGDNLVIGTALLMEPGDTLADEKDELDSFSMLPMWCIVSRTFPCRNCAYAWFPLELGWYVVIMLLLKVGELAWPLTLFDCCPASGNLKIDPGDCEASRPCNDPCSAASF
jgi:hypothetical protein